MDNININNKQFAMNTIKFLPHNKVLLNNTTLLNKINYTKNVTEWYTIKNNNYEKI